MNRHPIQWLRISYWAGAVLDLISVFMMIFPALFAFNYQLSGFASTPAFRYAMGMGAPLMLAWTVLLVWADRKPLERRGILPITILVILGEVINELIGVQSRFISIQAASLTWFAQAVLIALMAFSYSNSRKVETA
jgi:hypothetical protein